MTDETHDPDGVGLAGLFDGLEGSAGAPELSLRGLALEAAAPLLEQALQDGAANAWLAIRFDAPSHAGAHSLFQPVGRRLRGALRDGRITVCRPLPRSEHASDASLGFVVRFSG